MSVGTYRESNSISEFKFTLRPNLFGLLDSSCIRESLSSVFDVFVIAVYLPSLRHKNFLRTEREREAEFTSLLSFQHPPAHWLIGASTTQIVEFPRATQALNPKDKSPAF